MKKVLLVTLQGANIGNRLQNYALQETIKKYGFSVYTPYYNSPECNSMRKRIIKNIMFLFSIFGMEKYIPIRLAAKRERIFKSFDSNYIDNRFKTSFKSVNGSYDYAITGSDQVWHRWSDDYAELDYFYLSFFPENKRISYAASFGFDRFPEKDIEIHKRGLNGIHYLSCREEDAKKLIKELTGREAVVTLDPTLLLRKKEWECIEKKPCYDTGDYLFVYFLGEKTLEYQRIINKIADDNNLKIIDIYDQKQIEYFYSTPDEFVWLIHHAAFVCTDSYHACVFSIIFEKKFLAFRRHECGMEKMFGRIETLFNLFDIDREFKGEEKLIYKDYKRKNIDEEIEKSQAFLLNALATET